MAFAGVDAIERHLEHQLARYFAHRAEAIEGVLPDKCVEPLQFGIGEARIGLAHRQQFRARISVAVPAAEGVIGIEARPFAAAALRIHQHAIDQQRIAFPLVPQRRLASRHVRAVTAFEHQAFDRFIAGGVANRGERGEILRLDQLGQIEMTGGQARHQGFQSRAARLPRLFAPILPLGQQHIIQAHEGGELLEHPGRHGLAPQPLLQRVEAGRAARFAALFRTAHQQFAIEHGVKRQGGEQFGKGRGNIVARPRIDSHRAASAHQLYADAVPLPFGGIVRKVDFAVLQRMREHEGPKMRGVRQIGRRAAACGPAEQFGIGRGQRVPIFLNLLDCDIKRLRKGGLGQPRRYADAHAASRQLDQRIAALGVHPVEQAGQFLGRSSAGEGREARHHLGQRQIAVRRAVGRRGPQQAGGFRRIAHEIAAEAPQQRIDAFFHQRADGAGFDRGEIQPLGQPCQRPAAIRIRRAAQIIRDQRQFAVAAGGVDQSIEQGGEGLHQAAIRCSLRSHLNPLNRGSDV